MIIGSIAGSTGWPVTFGIISAISAICLIVATTVTSSQRALSLGGYSQPTSSQRALSQLTPSEYEALGEAIESSITELCDAGADEQALRALVGQAFRLGRSSNSN